MQINRQGIGQGSPLESQVTTINLDQSKYLKYPIHEFSLEHE